MDSINNLKVIIDYLIIICNNNGTLLYIIDIEKLINW